MPIVIAIGIANLWIGNDGATPIPTVCFATTDWNLYNAQDWNNIITNWNDCL